MKKITMLLIFFVSISIVSAGVTVSKNVALSSARYEVIQAEGLTELQLTECIPISETTCRVEDKHSGSGNIVRFDVVNYDTYTPEELSNYIDLMAKEEIEKYADSKLSTTTTTTIPAPNTEKTISIVENKIEK